MSFNIHMYERNKAATQKAAASASTIQRVVRRKSVEKTGEGETGLKKMPVYKKLVVHKNMTVTKKAPRKAASTAESQPLPVAGGELSKLVSDKQRGEMEELVEEVTPWLIADADQRRDYADGATICLQLARLARMLPSQLRVRIRISDPATSESRDAEESISTLLPSMSGNHRHMDPALEDDETSFVYFTGTDLADLALLADPAHAESWTIVAQKMSQPRKRVPIPGAMKAGAAILARRKECTSTMVGEWLGVPAECVGGDAEGQQRGADQAEYGEVSRRSCLLVAIHLDRSWSAAWRELGNVLPAAAMVDICGRRYSRFDCLTFMVDGDRCKASCIDRPEENRPYEAPREESLIEFGETVRCTICQATGHLAVDCRLPDLDEMLLPEVEDFGYPEEEQQQQLDYIVR